MSYSSSSPPPPHSAALSTLAVFRNTINQELVRSVHAYRNEQGEETQTEREFILSPTFCTEIPGATPLIIDRDHDRQRLKFAEGEAVGPWLCVLAYDSSDPSPPLSIPPFRFSRMPQLESVPSLADDLRKIYSLMTGVNNVDEGGLELPTKRRRATTDRVASISLPDLAKYFNLPITEACRNLNVGLTVLKRKCREFGIRRWPHRKIKSLDTLIHDLQEEVSRQEEGNEAAAVRAAARRQRMLEREKEGIERSPLRELLTETKRFRQDVFKRRHNAKVRGKVSSLQPALS